MDITAWVSVGLVLLGQAFMLVGWIIKRDNDQFKQRELDIRDHVDKHDKIWDEINVLKVEQKDTINRDCLDERFEKFELRLEGRLKVISDQLGELMQALWKGLNK